jgi:hypothetical protein
MIRLVTRSILYRNQNLSGQQVLYYALGERWVGITWSLEKYTVVNKLELTGQNLGQVFNFRYVHACIPCTSFTTAKLSNLKLKTWPKQFISSLVLSCKLSRTPILCLPGDKHSSLFVRGSGDEVNIYVTLITGVCIIKHNIYIMYELCRKLLYLSKSL